MLRGGKGHIKMRFIFACTSENPHSTKPFQTSSPQAASKSFTPTWTKMKQTCKKLGCIGFRDCHKTGVARESRASVTTRMKEENPTMKANPVAAGTKEPLEILHQGQPFSPLPQDLAPCSQGKGRLMHHILGARYFLHRGRACSTSSQRHQACMARQ